MVPLLKTSWRCPRSAVPLPKNALAAPSRGGPLTHHSTLDAETDDAGGRAQTELCKLGVRLLGSLYKDFSKIFTNPSCSLQSGRTHRIMDGTTNDLHVVLKQLSKFDGKRADNFLEWSPKLRVSLSIYNRAIFNILQGQERPSETDDSQATARTAWDAANQDIFSIMSFSTGGSDVIVVWRFVGTTLEDGAGHGQQAWGALREKFKGSSREAIRAEHSKMNNTRMRSEQDPDEYLYIMDSCRDRLNACDSPEGPTDRQYEDILLQDLPSEYKAIRQAHLGRGDFGLADIRRMMAAISADNLARSRSDSFRGIVGRGAAMQTMTRDRNDIKCHFCGRVGHFKSKCSLRVKQQQQENYGQ